MSTLQPNTSSGIRTPLSSSTPTPTLTSGVPVNKFVISFMLFLSQTADESLFLSRSLLDYPRLIPIPVRDTCLSLRISNVTDNFAVFSIQTIRRRTSNLTDSNTNPPSSMASVPATSPGHKMVRRCGPLVEITFLSASIADVTSLL